MSTQSDYNAVIYNTLNGIANVSTLISSGQISANESGGNAFIINSGKNGWLF